MISRHEIISEFLTMLGVEKGIAYQDTEGIEHHVQPVTIYSLEKLVDYLRKNPRQLRAIRDHIEKGGITVFTVRDKIRGNVHPYALRIIRSLGDHHTEGPSP